MVYRTCTLNCKRAVLRFTGNTLQLYWGWSRRHMPTHWFPNSAAMKRKPDLRTHMLEATGTVSKYFRRISVTWNITMSKYFRPISHLKCHNVKVLEAYLSPETQRCQSTSDLSLSFETSYCQSTTLSHETPQCQSTSGLSVTLNTTLSKYFRCICHLKYHSVKVLQT